MPNSQFLERRRPMGKELNKMFSIIETLKSMTPSNFGLMLDIGTKLAGADASVWANAFKTQLKTGTNIVSPELLAHAPTAGKQHELLQRIYDKYFAKLAVTVPAFADLDGKVGVYVAEALTCDMIYTAWTFYKWQWCSGSIDAQLDMTCEARSSIGSYLVRVKNGVEPDQKFLDKSTRSVDANGSIGITLRERMLLELMHFEETGKHLDIRGATFCSGSRYLDGDVPGVCLGRGGRVYVSRYHSDNSHDRCGVREAVLEAL